MAKKGNANIKVTADIKDADSNLNKITATLNKVAKAKTINSLGKLGNAFSAVNAAVSAATGAVKAAAAAVNETVEAYKVQANAETQLETAVRNNPYLRDESVQKLKDYASHLQAIGTVGDETLIPLMAQLVSAGRSEAETMEIMSASLDASASGAISLDSAVKALSKSYSGEAGELSTLNPKVKELTKEQLKSGDAVKLIADSYKGMAQDTANATGGMQKLKNSWGDFLEVLGKPINAVLNPIAAAFSSFIDKINGFIQQGQEQWNAFLRFLHITDSSPKKPEINFKVEQSDIDAAKQKVNEAKKTVEELEKAVSGVSNMTDEELSKAVDEALKLDRNYQEWLSEQEKAEDNLSKLNDLQKLMGDDKNLKDVWKSLSKDQKKYFSELGIRNTSSAEDIQSVIEQTGKKIKNLSSLMEEERAKIDLGGKKGAVTSIVSEEDIQNAKNALKQAELDYQAYVEAKEKQDKAAMDKEAADLAAAQKDELEKTQDFIDKQLAIVSNGEALQNQKIKDGMQENFDWDSYASSVLSAYQNIYSEMGTLAYDGSKAEIQKALDLLKSYYVKAQKELYSRKDFAGLKDEINGIVTDTNTTVEAQIGLLEKLKEKWADIPEAVNLVDEAIKKLKETTDGSMTKFQEWYAEHGDTFKKSQEIVSKMNDAMDEYTSGQIQRYENEKDAALASLEKQHDEGLVSEEAYEAQKQKIEKAAAEKEYKLKLAQWASNVATTTGQIAMGVVNALANSGSPYVAIPMAAAVGALGAAQLATLIGSKPVPPSYATGGVVGGFQGATTGGDNTYIHARDGEMMLNARQQRNLFDMANSSGASGGIKVNIRNYMGESAEVTPELTGGTLNLIIDRRVTGQLSSGAYGEALTRSDLKRQGTLISN